MANSKNQSVSEQLLLLLSLPELLALLSSVVGLVTGTGREVYEDLIAHLGAAGGGDNEDAVDNTLGLEVKFPVMQAFLCLLSSFFTSLFNSTIKIKIECALIRPHLVSHHSSSK